MALLEEILESGGGRWALGAAAVVGGVTLVRRAGRPVVKTAIKGYLALSEGVLGATSGLRAALQGIYADARAEAQGAGAPPSEPERPKPRRTSRASRASGASARGRAAKAAAAETTSPAGAEPSRARRRSPRASAAQTSGEKPPASASGESPAAEAPAPSAPDTAEQEKSA